MTTSHSIVICTKDRADTLIEFMTQLSKIDGLERSKIVIVENSPTLEPFKEIERYLLGKKSLENVILLRSAPGLPRARNLALSMIDTEFVHFLDDDVVLPLDFIPAIEDVAKSFPRVIGFAPFIREFKSNSMEIEPKKFQRNQSKFFQKEGTLNKSGRAIWIQKPGRIIDVNWLPGCCMTYRASALEGMKFDEDLEKGPLGGYALGEDLVFSHELSKKGKLAGVGVISVIHKLAPNDRTNWIKMDEGIGRLRAYLFIHFPTQVKLPQVLACLLLEGLNDFVRVRVLKSKLTNSEHRYFARLFAFLSEYREPLFSKKRIHE
jgi:GT2 family glycosyltransferase